jgi:hypothetical protein
MVVARQSNVLGLPFIAKPLDASDRITRNGAKVLTAALKNCDLGHRREACECLTARNETGDAPVERLPFE